MKTDRWVFVLILSAVASLCSVIALFFSALIYYKVLFPLSLATFALCIIMMAISIKKI